MVMGNNDLYNFQLNQKPKVTKFSQNSIKSDILQQSIVPQENHFHFPSKNDYDLSNNRNLLEVGHQRSFWILNLPNLIYYKTNAILLAIGDKSYVFMEVSCISEIGDTAASEQADNVRDEFDDTIYPKVTELAGHPNGTLGDIDGDPRIIILLSHNLVSYYDQRNELQLEYSNLCEMFYIYYKIRIFPTITHEFHHLIWFNNEMDEPHFTLEALAEYSMYYTGYLAQSDNHTPRSVIFLDHPEDSLLYWNMYSPIDNLITEPTDGSLGIENVLKRAGYNITFNQLYLNWITALTIDETGFGSNLYGFVNLDAKITQFDLVRIPLLEEKVKLYYYGFHIHKIQFPPNNFTIAIRKNQDITIGFSIVFHDTNGWHIYQSLNNRGTTIITEKYSASKIDDLYVITSYISDQTPPLPTENGLGPSTEIQITLSHLNEDPIIPNGDSFNLLLAIIGSFTLVLTLIMIIIIKKSFRQKETHP